jgi:hypothetical protein
MLALRGIAFSLAFFAVLYRLLSPLVAFVWAFAAIVSRAAQVLADLGVGVGHWVASVGWEREALDAGSAASTSHWLSAAKPSRLISEIR